MILYGVVRALRGIVLGCATHTPQVAIISELVSVVPLYRNASRTIGGIIALSYSGQETARMLNILQEPMRKELETEFFFLVLVFISIVVS